MERGKRKVIEELVEELTEELIVDSRKIDWSLDG